MKKQVLVVLFIMGSLVIVPLLGGYGCGGEKDVAGPGDDHDIDILFNKAGDYTTPDTFYTETPMPDEQKLIDGEVWICRKEDISAGLAFDDFSIFDPNSEVIWPGSALQGRSIQFATPDPIIASRSGGTIVINNITGTEVSSVIVDEVSHSNVMDAANTIIRNQFDKFPADLNISFVKVRSAKELALKLNASASFFGLFSAQSKFEFIKNHEYSSFLVTLHQPLYTLSFERPPKASDFFHETVNVDDLVPFVGVGNYPVYVSSVTYGRVFYLLVSAIEKSDTLKTSISGSFLGLVEGGGDFKRFQELKGLSVQAYAVGGDSDGAFDAITNSLGSLRKFLQDLRDAADIRLAKPLSYNVRTVRSATSVKNELFDKFTVSDCIPVPAEMSVEPTLIDFGKVCQDNTVARELRIENTGGSIAHVEIVEPTCDPFGLDPGSHTCFAVDNVGPVELKPGEALNVQVSFSPRVIGFDWGPCFGKLSCEVMVIWRSRDDEHEIPVEIRGQGLTWLWQECQN